MFPMINIKALRDQRAAKATEARNLLDPVTTTFTSEVSAQVDAIYAEIDLIDSQIERAEKQAKIDGDAVNGERDREIKDRYRAGLTDEQRDQADAYSAAFKAFIVHGERGLTMEQAKALRDGRPQAAQSGSQSNGTQGGYLVPTGFGGELIEALKAYGGMRRVANIIQTNSGAPIAWPTVDETSQTGEIVAESTTAASQDVTFGTINIGSFKFSSKIFTVPFELLMDQGPGMDVEAYIRRAAATRIARIQNNKFTVGAGTTEPKGALTAAASGVVGPTGETLSCTYDDLINLIHSVDPAYRSGTPDGDGGDAPKVGFMFHDTTLRNLKKLKDTQGRPLWLPSVAGGEPDRFLDYTYTVNQDMPVMAANAKSILFGDFGQYLIRDIMEVTLFRFDDSPFITKGQIGFLAWARADGNLMTAGAPLKYFQNSAT
jgi:HK97 family phage major capsid protein